MARRFKDIVIVDDGRDKDRVFRITEKSAMDAEWWAARVLQAVAKGGVDIGDLEGLGMQGVAVLGLKGIVKMDPRDAKPLLDEMMECVVAVPDPIRNPAFVVSLANADPIEEVKTLIQLRAEVFTLHTGFSLPAGKSTGPLGATAGARNSSNMKTSRAR